MNLKKENRRRKRTASVIELTAAAALAVLFLAGVLTDLSAQTAIEPVEAETDTKSTQEADLPVTGHGRSEPCDQPRH